MLFLQLVTLLLLLMVSYFSFNREICHPSVLLCAVFILSVVCAMYNIDNWGIDYHWETYLVITSLTAVFIFVGFFCSAFEKKPKRTAALYLPEIKEIAIPTSIFIAVLFVDLICIFLLYRGVSEIAAQHGGGVFGSISDMLNTYKAVASYENSEKLSFIADKGRKFSDSCAYIFIIALAFNLARDRKSLKRWKHYLIPIFLGFVSSYLNSGRLQMLMLVAAAAFSWMFISYWKSSWTKIYNGKKIAILCLGIVVVLGGFYLIRVAVGRTSSESKGLLEYITMYAGGSIQLFNLYLQKPASSTGVFGFETFYTLITNLNNYGFLDYSSLPTMHLEFRYHGMTNIGNVYTAYRRWIADFGLGGAFILQIVLSMVFHLAYYKLKRKSDIQQSFSFVLLVYLVPTLMMQSIDSVFYRTVFSFSFIFELFFLYVLYRICIYAPLRNTAISSQVEGLDKRRYPLRRSSSSQIRYGYLGRR